MPAFFTTRCIIKLLSLSNLSQSIHSPPASDRHPSAAAMQLSSLHVEAGSRKEEELERPATHQTDIWSSILSGKETQGSKTDLAPPYIHPMVKRSANSLSDKSLEICTESLGSETGSDGFSGAYQDQDEYSDVHVEYEFTKKNGGYCKRPALPPPLPSMSLRMRSRRQNGRLVMEAVSVPAPAKSCFLAERRNGRLLLTFSDHNPCNEQGNSSSDFSDDEESINIEAEVNDVADRDGDVERVTSAGGGGGLSRPYVYQYGRYNKLQPWPCKRAMLLLKEPHCILTS